MTVIGIMRKPAKTRAVAPVRRFVNGLALAGCGEVEEEEEEAR